MSQKSSKITSQPIPSQNRRPPRDFSLLNYLRLRRPATMLLRTTVSVIVISSLLLYRALVADQVNPGKNSDAAKVNPEKSSNDDQSRIQRLEQRVKELEQELHAKQEVQIPKIATKSVFSNHQHPIDVAFLNYKDRKRILITGGAGFVGSHLTDRLMLAGHEVIVADNMFTGRKRNVEHWIGHPNFDLLNHDIVNPLYIEVDEVFHLASPASPPHYMYNPVKTIKTNTVGTVNALGLAKRVNAKILIASTSEVYGDPEVHPQVETYWGHVNPIGPRACYDERKRVAETMCYAYQKQSGVPVRVARIFNTFGPRMHMADGRVVSNFILQALQNEDITIYGSGKQTRSSQDVTDLVDGLRKLMNSEVSSPVNIGNPDEHTIQDFAEIIKKLVNSKSTIKHMPATEDDPQMRRPDITKAKNQIGWAPRVDMMLGLERTIKYFDD